VGVTADLMGVGQPTTTPGLELSLRRITIAPGGGVPPHSHPGALVIYTESGSWGYTHLGGTVQLTRAAGEGTATAAEGMPVGEEVILNAGDWLFVEDPQDDIRNTGEEDLNVLVAGLTPVGEPFTTLMSDMDMAATPTP
jgi:redox-sensitive bicupin YhaK (pirin superfamily)